MILETCLAICINAFFAWPVDISYNLGERVHGITAVNKGIVMISPYASDNENIIVTIIKTKTVGGCAKVMVQVDPLHTDRKIAYGIKPMLLIIEKVCPGKKI